MFGVVVVVILVSAYEPPNTHVANTYHKTGPSRTIQTSATTWEPLIDN